MSSPDNDKPLKMVKASVSISDAIGFSLRHILPWQIWIAIVCVGVTVFVVILMGMDGPDYMLIFVTIPLGIFSFIMFSTIFHSLVVIGIMMASSRTSVWVYSDHLFIKMNDRDLTSKGKRIKFKDITFVKKEYPKSSLLTTGLSKYQAPILYVFRLVKNPRLMLNGVYKGNTLIGLSKPFIVTMATGVGSRSFKYTEVCLYLNDSKGFEEMVYKAGGLKKRQ